MLSTPHRKRCVSESPERSTIPSSANAAPQPSLDAVTAVLERITVERKDELVLTHLKQKDLAAYAALARKAEWRLV